MTSGEYGEHAFLIKNIKKLAKVYECEHSHSRFTHAGRLQERRLSLIDCLAENVEALETNFEGDFFPQAHRFHQIGYVDWKQGNQRQIYIYQEMFGHGGKR